MNVNDLSESKYLTKNDVEPAILVTIQGWRLENMSHSGQPVENKLILDFVENVKPLACNVTNANIIAALTGQEDTNHWAGNKIVLYNDPLIMFGTKVTGGIRVRAAKNQAAAPTPAPKDDIPF